nr:MAG TPA: hypothetical protein [Caudoviricetes sp.]
MLKSAHLVLIKHKFQSFRKKVRLKCIFYWKLS